MAYFMPATVAVPRPSLPARCRQEIRGFRGLLLVAPLAGAVGRIIVDDQNVHLRRETENLRDQPGQVFPFIVGGHANQSFAGRGHDLRDSSTRWDLGVEWESEGDPSSIEAGTAHSAIIARRFPAMLPFP